MDCVVGGSGREKNSRELEGDINKISRRSSPPPTMVSPCCQEHDEARRKRPRHELASCDEFTRDPRFIRANGESRGSMAVGARWPRDAKPRDSALKRHTGWG